MGQNDLKLQLYEVNDYITKVVKQAYEGITERKYSSDDVEILMFVIDDDVFITWKILEYSPMAYKIPIKVRYRLRNNFNKHFNGNFNIFTKHTLELENSSDVDSITYKINNCDNVYVYKSCNSDFASEVLGENLYNVFNEKVCII